MTSKFLFGFNERVSNILLSSICHPQFRIIIVGNYAFFTFITLGLEGTIIFMQQKQRCCELKDMINVKDINVYYFVFLQYDPCVDVIHVKSLQYVSAFRHHQVLYIYV
jgi:hypothetical protein